jgi:hypothetical protein
MGNAAGGAVRHGMGWDEMRWDGMGHGALGGEWQDEWQDGWMDGRGMGANDVKVDALVACTPQRDANTVHGTQQQLTTAQHRQIDNPTTRAPRTL